MATSASRIPRRDLAPTRIHPSLVRPILVAGLERELAIPLVGAVLILLFAFRPNLLTPALALGLLLGVVPWLRSVAKRDPQAFSVFKGHLRIAGFYTAQAPHDQPRRSRQPSF